MQKHAFSLMPEMPHLALVCSFWEQLRELVVTMCSHGVSYALLHNSRALMSRCLLRRCNLDVERKRTSTLSFQGPHPRPLRTPCHTSGIKMAGSATALVLCHLTSSNSQSSRHHMNPCRLLLRQPALLGTLLGTLLQMQKLPTACNHIL